MGGALRMIQRLFVYVLDRLPYPDDGAHLRSRLGHTGEDLIRYEQSPTAALIVAKGFRSKDVLDTNDEIVQYINDRKATVLHFYEENLGAM